MSLLKHNLKVHARLDQLFLAHQVALLDMKVPLARKHFAAYKKELLAHMRHEERELLPIYKRGGEVKDVPTIFFTGEHKRMREFLGRIKSRLRRLSKSKSMAVGLFDLEAAYKSLVDHHDRREKAALYPALDRMTTEEERKKLFLIYNK